MLILSACQGGANLPPLEAGHNITASEESVLDTTIDNYERVFVVPPQIADGIFDLGAALFSEPEVFFSARTLSGNRLIVENVLADESIIYNYITGEILHRFSPALRRLGTDHFYSQRQDSENSYTITLYDHELTILAEHYTTQPAIPVIDGIHILYDARASIRIRNIQTNEEGEISVSDISPKPEHGGGMIWWDFDGQWVFSTANHAPAGTPQFSELWMRAVGAYNVITSQSIFSEDFPQAFAGIPETFGSSSAIFWQDGSAFGTDGTYSVIVDAQNSDIRIVDVGITANHISDNGSILVAVDAVSIEWENDIFDFPVLNTTLSQIILHDAYSLAPISSRSFEPLIGAMGGSFGGVISVSEDGRYVFLRGFIYEGGSRRQSLFMIEMGAG